MPPFGGPAAIAAAAAGAATLLGAGVVFACSPAPPQLTLTPDQAVPGQPVTGAGTGFGAGDATVVVRLDGHAGPVLWSGPADPAGHVAFSFVTPAVAPGFDFVNAYPSGIDASKGPAHASFQVTAAGTVPAGTGAPRPSVAPASSSARGDAPAAAPVPRPGLAWSSATVLLPTIAIALLGLSGLAGFVLARRRGRTKAELTALRSAPPGLRDLVVIARYADADTQPRGDELEARAASRNSA